MSPGFETALARLYVDDAAWELFLREPQRLFQEQRLSDEEARALAEIDLVSLEAARESFRAKRARQSPPPGFWERLVRR